jgi:DNA-binding transcriptional ArsR family regulator
MSDRPDPESLDPKLVRALAHPLRVEILRYLTDHGEASPKEMAQPLGRATQLVSYHTKVLVECECVYLSDTEKRRGAIKHFYRANPHSFIGSQEWRKIPRALRGKLTANSLEAFMGHAVSALEKGTIDDHEDTTFTWFPLSVDAIGRIQVAEIMVAAIAQLRAAHDQSAQRVPMTGEELIPLVIGLAAFEIGTPAKEDGPQ